MRQTLGKTVNESLVNPSKFGGDGRAVNTVHCLKAILNEYEDCTNPNCERSHVPSRRDVFDTILSMDAHADGRDVNRDFLLNVLRYTTRNISLAVRY
jgi:hypothetical protein